MHFVRSRLALAAFAVFRGRCAVCRYLISTAESFSAQQLCCRRLPRKRGGHARNRERLFEKFDATPLRCSKRGALWGGKWVVSNWCELFFFSNQTTLDMWVCHCVECVIPTGVNTTRCDGLQHISVKHGVRHGMPTQLRRRTISWIPWSVICDRSVLNCKFYSMHIASFLG